MASQPAQQIDVRALSSGSMLHRWMLALPLMIALGVLIADFAINARSALTLIRFPFGVDYGEGIVWQQMRNILDGRGYAPLGVYPAIVFHYPPIYHVVAGLLSHGLGTDELATARALSWAATLGTAALAGILSVSVAQRRLDPIAAPVGGLLVALLYLSCGPVVEWAALMRVDMLAYLFGLGGLLIALRAIERPAVLHFAALCFTLAIYTKQVSIAAPAAAFAGLMAVRPRLAWKLAAITFAQSGLLLLALSWITQGNFLRHIILYNVNRVDPKALLALIEPLRRHLIYICLASAGAFMLVRRIRYLWRDRQNHPLEVASSVALLGFFALKTLMLAMVVKSGASLNYTIEWLCAVAIMAGIVILPIVETASARLRRGDVTRDTPGTPILLFATILLVIAFQVWELPRLFLTPAGARVVSGKMTPLVDLIRGSPKPVISDDMTLLIRAGRPVEWEPAIAAELGATGQYDQIAFARLIRQGHFGLFITEGHRGDAIYDGRYNPPVADAIAIAYPREYKLGRFTIHAPAR